MSQPIPNCTICQQPLEHDGPSISVSEFSSTRWQHNPELGGISTESAEIEKEHHYHVTCYKIMIFTIPTELP